MIILGQILRYFVNWTPKYGIVGPSEQKPKERKRMEDKGRKEINKSASLL